VPEVRQLVAHHPSFTVTFADCGQFPDVLFLVPDPDDPFRALTTDLFRRWPDIPPYGGLITDYSVSSSRCCCWRSGTSPSAPSCFDRRPTAVPPAQLPHSHHPMRRPATARRRTQPRPSPTRGRHLACTEPIDRLRFVARPGLRDRTSATPPNAHGVILPELSRAAQRVSLKDPRACTASSTPRARGPRPRRDPGGTPGALRRPQYTVPRSARTGPLVPRAIASRRCGMVDVLARQQRPLAPRR
jgi:hypothetical protein